MPQRGRETKDRSESEEETAFVIVDAGYRAAVLSGPLGDSVTLHDEASLGGTLRATFRTARPQSGQPDTKRITVGEYARILLPIEIRDPESAALAIMPRLQGARERVRPE